MFATVRWILTRPYDTLFLPESAVATDLKGTFVIAVRSGRTARVAVTEGQTMGELTEVEGELKPGELVALKATDELKRGTLVTPKEADRSAIAAAEKHTGAGSGGGE